MISFVMTFAKALVIWPLFRKKTSFSNQLLIPRDFDLTATETKFNSMDNVVL